MIQDALCGLDLYPWYALEHHNVASARQFRIVGAQTGNGDAMVRIPVRSVNAAREANGSRCIVLTEEWTIDLDEMAIDEVNLIGGIIDGISLTPNSQYLIWALFDFQNTTKIFKGSRSFSPKILR